MTKTTGLLVAILVLGAALRIVHFGDVRVAPDFVARDMREAVIWILREEGLPLPEAPGAPSSISAPAACCSAPTRPLPGPPP